MRNQLLLATALSVLACQHHAFAADDTQQLSQEIQEIKAAYKSKIDSLEQRLQQLETQKVANQGATQPLPAPVTSAAPSNPNAFNPAISLILNGEASSFSAKNNSVSGFAVGDEAERGKEGLSIGESELTIGANVDDMFTGQFTGSVATEDGEDKLEIEEAFVQTLGLPYGANVKAGRMLANLGYMNEKHAHTDDFADRPLPYRAFLNNAFNDDGVQLSIILPTDLFTEVGGGAWRGDDFPGGSSDGASPGSYSAYARVGGDIGDNQTWRLGASYLHSSADGDGRVTGEAGKEVSFKGDDNLYIADAKYTWAPTGNSNEKELSLQGEYFLRHENGTYADNSIGLADTAYNGNQSGYYGQAVFKFLPQWRAGYRFTGLMTDNIPVAFAGSSLDGSGHDPYIHSAMIDYSHSEFSRIRLQYNNDHAGPETDHQIIAQYIMSLGTHGAHKY